MADAVRVARRDGRYEDSIPVPSLFLVDIVCTRTPPATNSDMARLSAISVRINASTAMPARDATRVPPPPWQRTAVESANTGAPTAPPPGARSQTGRPSYQRLLAVVPHELLSPRQAIPRPSTACSPWRPMNPFHTRVDGP